VLALVLHRQFVASELHHLRKRVRLSARGNPQTSLQMKPYLALQLAVEVVEGRAADGSLRERFNQSGVVGMAKAGRFFCGSRVHSRRRAPALRLRGWRWPGSLQGLPSFPRTADQNGRKWSTSKIKLLRSRIL
jgi:hypothetical protein